MFGKRKIILIDWGVFLHRSVFGYYAQQTTNPYITKPEKLALMGMFACLRTIGVRQGIDEVIIALDSPNNWRKKVDPQYKANRKEARKRPGIDWDDIFVRFNKVLTNLEEATPFHLVAVPTLEADDIISAAVRKFPDDEVIAVTVDSDFDQLFAYDNFSFFSITTKNYKIPVKNPYEVLQKKIKSEPTDNLISPINTLQEHNIRKKIVNLITLPANIEDMAKKALDNLPEKEYNVDRLFYGDSKIRESYERIYNPGLNFRKSFDKKQRKTKNKKPVLNNTLF